MDLIHEQVEDLTKDLAKKDTEFNEMRVKLAESNRLLERYNYASELQNYFEETQRSSKDSSGIGFNSIPPPLNANYSKSIESIEQAEKKIEKVDKSNLLFGTFKPEEVKSIESENVVKFSSDFVVQTAPKIQQPVQTNTVINKGKTGSHASSSVIYKPVVNKNDEKLKMTEKPKKKKELSCFKCHEKGHVASVCPNKDRGPLPRLEQREVKTSEQTFRPRSTVVLGSGRASNIGKSVSFEGSTSRNFDGPRNRSPGRFMGQSYYEGPRNRTPNRFREQTSSSFRQPNQYVGQSSSASSQHNSGRSWTPNRYNTPRRAQTPNRTADNFYDRFGNSRYEPRSTPRPKIEVGNSSQPRSILRKSKSPVKENVILKEITFVDEKGITKTVMAWVPRDH